MEKREMEHKALIEKFRQGTISEAELGELRCWLRDGDADEIIKALEIDGCDREFEPRQESVDRLREMVYGRIERKPSRQGFFKSVFWQRYAAAAGVLMPLLLVGLYLALNAHADPHYMSVTTKANNSSRVVLPDGSEAFIKGRTNVRFPVAFDGNERRVTLDGNAFFDVAKDEGHPFVVETDDVSVKALGTQFSIMENGSGTHTEVYLESGKVEVTAIVSKQMVELLPGQTAVVDNQTGTVTTAEASQTVTVDWVNDEITYNRVSPDSLVHSVESNYGIVISPKVRESIDSRFSGTLPANDLATTMEVLSSVYGFEIPYSYRNGGMN